MSIRDEIERIEQSNDIAYKVIEVAQNKAPGEFVTLDFRYGIADALWDAGYRKVEQADREPSGDNRVQAVRTGAPEVQLLACNLCGVLLWDIAAHYVHSHESCGHPNHGAGDHDCAPFRPEPKPSDAEVEAGARALWEARRSPTNHTWDAIAEGGLNRPYPTYPHIVDDIRREARAALLAAQEVRNRG